MTLNQKDPMLFFLDFFKSSTDKSLTSLHRLNFISCIGRYRCFYLRFSKSHYKQCKVFILGECTSVWFWNKKLCLENQTRISSWNQPVLSNERKIVLLKKAKEPLYGLDLKPDRHRPITSGNANHCPTQSLKC